MSVGGSIGYAVTETSSLIASAYDGGSSLMSVLFTLIITSLPCVSSLKNKSKLYYSVSHFNILQAVYVYYCTCTDLVIAVS